MLCAEFRWHSHGGKRNKKTEPKPIQRIGKRVSRGMCGNERLPIILGGPRLSCAPPLRTIRSASVVFVYTSTRKNKNHSQTTLLTQHTPDSWKQQRRMTNRRCRLFQNCIRCPFSTKDTSSFASNPVSIGTSIEGRRDQIRKWSHKT